MLTNKYVIISILISFCFIIGFGGYQISQYRMRGLYKTVINQKMEEIENLNQTISKLYKEIENKNKQILKSEERYKNLLKKMHDIESKPIQHPKTDEEAVKLLKEMGYGKK